MSGSQTHNVYRYMLNPGQGASSSRNVGAAAATGEVLAFLDDDDTWHPTYLRHVVERFQETNADAIVTWRIVVRGSRKIKYPNVREGLRPTDVLATNPGVGGPNLCIKSSVYSSLKGFDEDLPISEDKDLFFRLLDDGYRYAVVRQELVQIGEHVGERLTRVDQRLVDGLRAYYEKHKAACRPPHHIELRRKIIRAQWRATRDRLPGGLRRHLYTIGVILLSRPQYIPSWHQLKELVKP